MSEEKRKLYEVTVNFTFYAYTETPDSAEDFTREAIDDAFIQNFNTVREVTHKNWPIVEWDEDSLIYHLGRADITLGDALAKLPDSVKAYKKEEK